MSPRSPSAWSADIADPDDAAQRLYELGSLYEVAWTLLGAPDALEVASRVVLSTLGCLGARSGAFLLARGEMFLLAYGSGVDPDRAREPLGLSDRARAVTLETAVLALDADEARALGGARRTLREVFDAALVAAVPSSSSGLAALLLVGPRLTDAPYTGADRDLVAAFAGLAGRALHARPLDGPSALEFPARAGGAAAHRLAELRATFPPLASMVGRSAALLEVFEDIRAVAPARCAALLLGDSGSGKELAARAIHELSDRASGPFEVVDCGSIPPTLIESELFGHVRGSFTGAVRDRKGAFELADGGTLLLDEIGEMPLESQTRLLRVLQEGRFRRVGGERTEQADVRLIAATNRDLRQAVAERRFREDLFYRLNVFVVRIPSLDERAEDVPDLLLHFLDRESETRGRGGWHVERAVIDALSASPLPGNVRELRNLATGLAVSARERERIDLADLTRVWRRQHSGTEAPWERVPPARRDDLGAWVLDQARRARFNLVEAERRLRRAARTATANGAIPLSERSALSYYLDGEMIRALVRADGDVTAAARALAAGDEDLMERAARRLGAVLARLGRLTPEDVAAGRLSRGFAKLPDAYADDVCAAVALVRRAARG